MLLYNKKVEPGIGEQQLYHEILVSSNRSLADAVNLSDVELHGKAVSSLVSAPLDPIESRASLGGSGEGCVDVDVDLVLHEERIGGAELAGWAGESKRRGTGSGGTGHLSIVLCVDLLATAVSLSCRHKKEIGLCRGSRSKSRVASWLRSLLNLH